MGMASRPSDQEYLDRGLSISIGEAWPGHLAQPGPLYWDGRCLRCNFRVEDHPGLLGVAWIRISDLLWYLREGQSRRASDGIPLGFVLGMIFTLALFYFTGNMP